MATLSRAQEAWHQTAVLTASMVLAHNEGLPLMILSRQVVQRYPGLLRYCPRHVTGLLLTCCWLSIVTFSTDFHALHHC